MSATLTWPNRRSASSRPVLSRIASRRSRSVSRCCRAGRRAVMAPIITDGLSRHSVHTACMVVRMRYQTLGRAGLRVSDLFLGAMTFGDDWGWGAPPEECRRMIDAYAEAGGNVIDTANI